MSNLIITSLLAFVCLTVHYALGWRNRRSRLPPGPKPLPIVGNLFDLPKVRPWITYLHWSRKYDSDVLFLDIPNQPTIMLNSYQSAFDLLETRSRNYSDRPVYPSDVLTGWNFNMGLMPYGAKWRATRRTFHQYFNQAAVEQYHDIDTREVRAFLRRAAQSEEGARINLKSVSQTVSAIILDITYGMRIANEDDDFVGLSQRAIESANRLQIFWIEYFPWLTYIPSWIPGPYATALSYGRQHKPVVEEAKNRGFNAVAKAFAEGSANPSMAQKLMQKLHDQYEGTEEYTLQEEIAINATGIAYAAADKTQSSVISSFFIAMAMFPSVQQKAQRELDLIVGPDRLPTAEDLAALPFIQAIFLEAMRWTPVFPLSIPRRATADDEYNGFLIPKGTYVIANVWAILHDPVAYPDPETFDPDRFLRDGALNPDTRQPTAAFGFGRRICAGRHLAKNTVSLMMASILHVFNVEPADGSQLTTDRTAGMLTHPDDVPCCLKPRSAAALALLAKSESV